MHFQSLHTYFLYTDDENYLFPLLSSGKDSKRNLVLMTYRTITFGSHTRNAKAFLHVLAILYLVLLGYALEMATANIGSRC